MNDAQLDDLLTKGRPRTAADTHDDGLSAHLDRLVTQTHVDRAKSSLRLRPLFVLGGAVAAIALTAGAAAGAIYLQLPPFAELLPGEERILEAIPVEYLTAEGVAMSCDAYVDIANASPAAVDSVRVEIESRDWAGFGQSVYDSIDGAPAQDPSSVDPPADVTTAIAFAVADFVHATAPEIANMDDPITAARAGDPYVHTVSLLCGEQR